MSNPFSTKTRVLKFARLASKTKANDVKNPAKPCLVIVKIPKIRSRGQKPPQKSIVTGGAKDRKRAKETG
jgi:hypothetical protein